MAEPLRTLRKDEKLETFLKDADRKLVVLEFMKPDNQVCIFMKKEVDSIAQEMSKKAEFYALDVNYFKNDAAKYGVEALPAFVLIHKSDPERYVVVVGTDELKKAIVEEDHKIQSDAGQEERKTESAEQKIPGPQANSVEEPNTGTKTCSIL